MRLTDASGGQSLSLPTRTVALSAAPLGARGFLPDVLSEHAEVAGIMVRLREAYLNDLGGDLAGLVRLDDRLDAHLDGLRAAGEDGYMAAREALRAGHDGSLFIVAVLSLERPNDDDARQIVTVAEATLRGQRELATALEWVSPRRIEPWANAFSSMASPAHRAAALLARHVHRLPLAPIAAVVDEMSRDDRWQRRELAYRALAASAGDVGVSVIKAGVQDPQPEVRLAAQWAAHRKTPKGLVIDDLVAIAADAGYLAEEAFDLAARTVSADRAGELLERLPTGELGERAGIVAVAAAGRPSLVPWLMPRLRSAATARLAVWAYATLTGCDVVSEGLTRACSTPQDGVPNDDPRDPRTAVPPEYRVPWPDPDAFEVHARRWCATESRHARLILGETITREGLVRLLATGTQGQRNFAATELAIMTPREHVFAARAPGFRQRRALPLLGMA